MAIDEGGRAYLLALARARVEADLGLKAFEALSPYPGTEEKRGAFVTLKKNGELRGCIGRMDAEQELGKTISAMAHAAAFEDPRFDPIQKEELPQLRFEISVLSPMCPIKSPSEIVLGRHGVEIVKGFRRAVFLPQVATEWGWDLSTLLAHLCRKAGLSESAIHDTDTRFYVFEADVFGESD